MASPFLVINRTMQTLAVPVDTTRKQSSRGNGLESPLIQSFIVQAQLPVICRSLVSWNVDGNQEVWIWLTSHVLCPSFPADHFQNFMYTISRNSCGDRKKVYGIMGAYV